MCFMSLCSPRKLQNNPPALRVSIKYGAKFKCIAFPHSSFQFPVCLNLWLIFCYGCSCLSLPCPERECHRKVRLSCAFQNIHSSFFPFPFFSSLLLPPPHSQLKQKLQHNDGKKRGQVHSCAVATTHSLTPKCPEWMIQGQQVRLFFRLQVHTFPDIQLDPRTCLLSWVPVVTFLQLWDGVYESIIVYPPEVCTPT